MRNREQLVGDLRRFDNWRSNTGAVPRGLLADSADEIERLEKMLKAANHLLEAATGPKDGPTSWTETLAEWRGLLPDSAKINITVNG